MILDPHYLIRIMPAEGKYTWRVDFIPSSAEGIFMETRQAVLVLNGDLGDPGFLASFKSSAWLKIAVDGGLRYFRLADISPDILIGDLDSITPNDRSWAEAQHTQILQYPVDKDETDFELALSFALGRKVEKIRVAAGLGDRLDQTFANCFMLLDERLQNIDIRFDDGKVEVCLIRDSLQIEGQAGDMVSLIPLDAVVHGVTTSRMKYPLQDENLFMYRTRGISNVMQSTQAGVKIREGNLLCIHTRQEH